VYDETLATQLILPRLQREFSDWRLFDLNDPVVSVYPGFIHLIFVLRKPEFTQYPDAPYFVVDLDMCGSKVLRAYRAHWPGT